MSEAFDPYRKWLGIPPNEQPPNHYRLLGIALFEDDADTIHHAADRQMSHLRTFQSGKYATESQKLLNEVAAARLCLLDEDSKAEYDEQLRADLSPPVAEAAAPPSTPPKPTSPPPPMADGPPPPSSKPTVPQGTPVAVSVAPATPVVKSSRPRGGSYARRKKSSSNTPLVIGILCIGVIAFGGLVLAILSTGSGSSTVEAPNRVPLSSPSGSGSNFVKPPSRPRIRPPSNPRRVAPIPPIETPALEPPAEEPSDDNPQLNPTQPVNNNRPRTMEEIESQHVRSSLKDVRGKLSKRDLDAAKRILDGIEISIENAGMEAEYEREKMLHYYLSQFFSEGVRPGIRRLEPGESFEFHGDRVELVSVNDDTKEVTYKFNGIEATSPPTQIPTTAALVFAWKGFQRDNIDPYAYVYSATFIYLDGKNELSSDERLAAAKALWTEAELPAEKFLRSELGISPTETASDQPSAPLANNPPSEPNADPAPTAPTDSTGGLPDDDLIKDARFQLAKSIRDKYGRVIPPSAKQELADAMIEQLEQTSDAARKYVLFEKAIELTCELQQPSRVGELLTQWSEAQPIDHLAMLAHYLPLCRPGTEGQAASLLTMSEEGYQQARTAGRNEEAIKLAELALKIAAAVRASDKVHSIRTDLDAMRQ